MQSSSNLILGYLEKHTDRKISIAGCFAALFSKITHKKGERLFRGCDSWGTFPIIVDGIFRLYYLDDDGHEHAKGICRKNQVLAPIVPSATNDPVTFLISIALAIQKFLPPVTRLYTHTWNLQTGAHATLANNQENGLVFRAT